MKNKINIAELLKDCPKGMELYSPLCGECRVLNIYDGLGFDVICGDDTVYNFSYDGRYNIMGECCIFPSKEQRDWSKFQRPFKDGDIVFYSNTIAIFNEWGDETLFRTYCVLYTTVSNPMYQFEISIPLFGKGIRKEVRFATEKEKEKLFQAIKNNGYKWNAETKTLESPKTLEKFKPWTIQDAKDGDILAFNDETIIIFKDLYNKTSFHSYCHIEEGIFTISKEDMPDWWEGKGFYPATEEQHTFLFRKIKEAGYKWNPETKTLEKLPKFKDGDIIYNRLQKKICIYYLCEDEVPRIRYCRYNESNIQLQFEKLEYPIPIAVQDYRLATEEEKEKLFRAIKDNGYKWDAENKTLEKISKPKFKVGNRVQNKNTNMIGTIDLIINDEYEYRVSLKNGGITYILFEFQDDWELVKDDIKPKFKVGDRIKTIYKPYHYVIKGITDTHYTLEEVEDKFQYTEPIIDDKNWELVANKFDINTLKPFDKVLVRNTYTDSWHGQFYQDYDENEEEYPFECTYNSWKYCIPYESNEHLRGTTADCDKYYKNW